MGQIDGRGHRKNSRRAGLWWLISTLTPLFLAACAPDGGGKVNLALADPATLQSTHEAVALIRFAPPDPTCTALGMQIGIAEGGLTAPSRRCACSNSPSLTSWKRGWRPARITS